MARGAHNAEAAAVPSSQHDELEDDPQFAPQLQLAPPKPKRRRTKSTSSTEAKPKEAAATVKKRKPAPKVTKPSVTSSSSSSTSKLDKPQAAPSSHSASSSALERFRYKHAPPILDEKDSNAPYKLPRKRSRDHEDPKRADRGGSSKGDETGEDTMSKQAGKRARKAEEIVFTMPELDEDGEPIVPPSPAQVTSVPVAEAPPRSPTPKRRPSSDPVPKKKKKKIVPHPPSSNTSNSSSELPPGMQASLRRDPAASSSSSPRPPQCNLPSKASPESASDTTLPHKTSPTTPKVPRTAEDEQEIAGCLEALKADDFDMFELDEEVADGGVATEATR